jgi:hypothetical protein
MALILSKKKLNNLIGQSYLNHRAIFTKSHPCMVFGRQERSPNHNNKT